MNEIFPLQKLHYKRRIAMVVEYEGHGYFGWQIQSNASPTVQEVLSKAISKIANHQVNIVCAGRTDTGVSASRQVIHFDTDAKRSDYGWTAGVNTKLPDNIAVISTQETDLSFHARHRAFERCYRYVIYNQPMAHGILRRGMTWERMPIDAQLMHEAAQVLVGEHDFSAFRAVGCQAASPIKVVSSITVVRRHNMVVLEVRASAFLYHMVRNIVGSLLPIGRGEQPKSSMLEILQGKDRNLAGPTAPCEGLYLVDVVYPDQYEINCYELGPAFLANPKPYEN